MTSPAPGKPTSAVEVTHVSSHGVWLLASERELFLPYEDFPWFRDVPIGQVLNVREPSPGHYYWPDIDVDLSVQMIEHPERFPMRSAVSVAEKY